MDSNDVLGAMGGFMMGQMFARQIQDKPIVMHYVSIRVDRSNEKDFIDSLGDVMREVFLNVPDDIGFEFEHPNKGELKVWGTKQNRRIGQAMLIFGLCQLTNIS